MLMHVIARLNQQVARFEQRLTWNASNPQAGSTELWIFIDDGRLESKLSSTNCCHVSTRTAAEHH